ncbi:MAG: SDR family oxidoreductase [Bryobacterales bacterium]|nr:SDR family oxidoreductase [Bryobacteraceae bacterium]MDW8130084.1 SDR family oxidoreductase [Bryobacterales bacterium]
MHGSLRDREIILAGGSGGLGQAIAELLASEGARLVVSYRSNAQRAGRLRHIATQVLAADLAVAADRTRLLEAAPSLYGLVVLAGEPARVADPGEFETVLRRSLEVNLVGPVALAREAAERMKAAGTPGAIVLFSTMQAIGLFPGSLAYAAPKAGLLHAARVLAKEFRGPANVRVNVVCPGVIQAGMAEASIAAGKYDRYLAERVIPRFGRASDVARAVRFFLEPDNYITGQCLLVDGGLTL